MAFPAQFQDMQHTVIDKARLDQDFDTARVQDWLNAAYLTAVIETGFYQFVQDSVTLAPSATSVPLPPAIYKIEYIAPTGVDGTRWGPMTAVTMQQLIRSRAWQGGQVSTGAPSRYVYRSGPSPILEFWPNAIGGEVLHVYGWGLPTPMVNPTEVSVIPEPYQRVIEYGALIHAAEFQKDVLLIQQFQGDYQDWLQRFRAFKNRADTSQPEQFEVMFERPWPRRNDVDTGY